MSDENNKQVKPLFPLPIVFGISIATLLIMLVLLVGQTNVQKQLKTAVPLPSVAEWCPDQQDKIDLDSSKTGYGGTEDSAKEDCFAQLDTDCSGITLDDGFPLVNNCGEGCKVESGTFKCDDEVDKIVITAVPPASFTPQASNSPEPTGLWQVRCKSKCDCEVGCERYCPNKNQWVYSDTVRNDDTYTWLLSTPYVIDPSQLDKGEFGWPCYKDGQYEQAAKRAARGIVRAKIIKLEMNKCTPGSHLWDKASDKCDRGCVPDWATPTPGALQCIEGPVISVGPAACLAFPPGPEFAGMLPEDFQLYEGSQCCVAGGRAQARFKIRCTEDPNPPLPTPDDGPVETVA